MLSRMNARNGSNLSVLLVAVLVAIMPVAAYVGAYLGLTTGTSRNTNSGGTCRVYRSAWQAMIFLPATLVESAVTGHDVSPAWPTPGP